MTVGELQSVLSGEATLYEEVPNGGREGMPPVQYRDLYSGMSRQIPEEYLRREVRMIRDGKGSQEGRIDIELRLADAGGGKKKKVHRKSPA